MIETSNVRVGLLIKNLYANLDDKHRQYGTWSTEAVNVCRAELSFLRLKGRGDIEEILKDHNPRASVLECAYSFTWIQGTHDIN